MGDDEAEEVSAFEVKSRDSRMRRQWGSSGQWALAASQFGRPNIQAEPRSGTCGQVGSCGSTIRGGRPVQVEPRSGEARDSGDFSSTIRAAPIQTEPRRSDNSRSSCAVALLEAQSRSGEIH